MRRLPSAEVGGPLGRARFGSERASWRGGIRRRCDRRPHFGSGIGERFRDHNHRADQHRHQRHGASTVLVAGQPMHGATALAWAVVLPGHRALRPGHHHRGHLRRLSRMYDQPGQKPQGHDDRKKRPQARSHVISISRAAPRWQTHASHACVTGTEPGSASRQASAHRDSATVLPTLQSRLRLWRQRPALCNASADCSFSSCAPARSVP
jgi:hypothetical protein